MNDLSASRELDLQREVASGSYVAGRRNRLRAIAVHRFQELLRLTYRKVADA